MNWEEKILISLVEAYRDSRKNLGTNLIQRRTQAKPEKFYKKYRANDGDYDTIAALDKAVAALAERGFVSLERQSYNAQLQKIYLLDEQVERAESYLHQHYGYRPREVKRREVQRVVERYAQASPICAQECARWQTELKQNKLPKGYVELEQVLKMVAFLERNTHLLYLREVSLLVYGSSKYFEENTLEAVCKILRFYRQQPCAEGEQMDEILQFYYVRREQQALSLKGNFTLVLGGQSINFALLSSGVELSADILPQLERIVVRADKFMTIENRTSYLRYTAKDTVCFYLGGFANRFQRDFIKKVYADNPQLQYLHFGDIDAGGLYIHHNLCAITGAPFQTFCMSVQELMDTKYASCLQPLTKNDKVRLQDLQQVENYASTAAYMLEKNVKLEQEIISLELMRHSVN